jgi:hypothetical protein
MATELSASSEEFVGEFWFWKGCQVAIQGDFVGFLRAKAVGFSGDALSARSRSFSVNLELGR